MNIFEDLIDELKEENLLEETVIETRAAKEKAALEKDGTELDSLPAQSFEVVSELPATAENLAAEVSESPAEADENDFYRQRANDEVSFLQMVEQVFAGIERDQLKILPNPYDVWEVKKVLHSFLQISNEPQSAEHAQWQFKLLQETERWHSALSARSERILTAHLRRYCETSRPPLSSPALVSLARFFRNSTYSEQVRSKFDLVVTRLFSKENSTNSRETIFSREELVEHFAELYAEWSSVPLYPTEAENAVIAAIVQEFENFMHEAERARSFDELIKNNFFNRLHSFKESTNENFFAPLVSATAVESNVGIGNRYLELLKIEKELGNTARLEDRYGIAHDQAISEATGKTFALIELLNQKTVEPPIEEETVYDEPAASAEKSALSLNVESGADESAFGKWLVAAAVAAVLLVASFVYFGNSSAADDAARREAQTAPPVMELDTPILKDNLEKADIVSGTLQGKVLPKWSEMIEDEKKNVLKQMLKLGDAKGYVKVELIDRNNKPVASAANGSVFVLD